MKAIVFEGGLPGGPVERWLSEIRSRMAEELIRNIIETGQFDGLLLVTDKSLSVPDEVGILSTARTSSFDFGKTIESVLREHARDGFCYFSGGSALLMGPDGIAAFARKVKEEEGSIVANNAFSADFFGSTDSSLFLRGDLPPADNSVPIYISDRNGAKLISLPFSVESSFDVDTPTDALILSLAEGCPKKVRDAVNAPIPLLPSGRMELAKERIMGIKALMRRDYSDITLIGRVGPSAIIELNRTTKCRYRVFSEERGMRSFGRDEEGTARTLIAGIMREKGPTGALEMFMSQTQGLLFDDRVLFAALGEKPKADERYMSDLLSWELIPAGFVKELTFAAYKTGGVCLGGHSLVNSGAVAISK